MKTNKIKLETLLKFCRMSNVDLVITTKKEDENKSSSLKGKL